MISKFFRKIFWWLLVKGWLPDFILRWKVRNALQALASQIATEAEDYENKVKLERDFIEEIKTMPIAINQTDANEQHYEVPAEFYRIVLGPRLKYSSCLYKNPHSTLRQAELDMLETYAERSEMKDGMSLLDLGCGWGSVALYFAEKFPKSSVTALSNSASQKEYIMGQAREKGLSNLVVHTGDVAIFEDEDFKSKFDRVISIEMFEHMKNYEKLLGKISGWLTKEGKLFVHIFTHKWKSYHFKDDWMGKTFFTGGTMPSHNLLLHFQSDLEISKVWGMSGTHYEKTLNEWLERMDKNIDIVRPILKATYGEKWERWLLNWRLFFIVCAETFGCEGGSEWGLSHYLFNKRRT